MSKRVAAVLLGAALSAGMVTSAFAGHYKDGCGYYRDGSCCLHTTDRCCKQPSTYCGYQVGVVPAGKCSPMWDHKDSTFCGYLVGTYPAGKCVYGHCGRG